MNQDKIEVDLREYYKKVEFSGGDGSSFENAVKLCTKSKEKGVQAEYQYLDKVSIEKGMDGKLGDQMLNIHNNIAYDVISVFWEDGTEQTFYFDISEFYGKKIVITASDEDDYSDLRDD